MVASHTQERKNALMSGNFGFIGFVAIYMTLQNNFTWFFYFDVNKTFSMEMKSNQLKLKLSLNMF